MNGVQEVLNTLLNHSAIYHIIPVSDHQGLEDAKTNRLGSSANEDHFLFISFRTTSYLLLSFHRLTSINVVRMLRLSSPYMDISKLFTGIPHTP